MAKIESLTVVYSSILKVFPIFLSLAKNESANCVIEHCLNGHIASELWHLFLCRFRVLRTLVDASNPYVMQTRHEFCARGQRPEAARFQSKLPCGRLEARGETTTYPEK